MRTNEFKLRSEIVKRMIHNRKQTVKEVASFLGIRDLYIYLSDVKIACISSPNLTKLAKHLDVAEIEIADKYVPKESGFNKSKKPMKVKQSENEQLQHVKLIEESSIPSTPLVEVPKPKTSFYGKDKFGEDKLLFRIENGNAVIYIEGYIKLEKIHEAVPDVKTWVKAISGKT